MMLPLPGEEEERRLIVDDLCVASMRLLWESHSYRNKRNFLEDAAVAIVQATEAHFSPFYVVLTFK